MARFVFATIDPLTLPAGEEFVALVRDVAAKGHEAVLVHADPESPDLSPGVTFVRWATSGARSLRDGRLLLRLIRQTRPDAVAGRRAALNWSMVLGRLFRVPLRMAWDDTLPDANVFDAGRRGLWARSLRWRRALVYSCATRLFVASRASVEQMAQWFKVGAERCEVVGYGVAASREIGESQPGPTKEVVALGRLVRSKNHALLIRAVARLPSALRERLGVRIIGDGPERAALARLVADLGVEDVVSLAGSMDNRAARRAMASADVFVHPSLYDNLPFAIIEAFAEGLPVIATRVGGIPELIDDGTNGLLIDGGDEAGLARALERVLSDEPLREKLGANARARFYDCYEMDAWAARVSALLLNDVRAR
jgi:glycosyltransferase involved in cell wall biosynthesis